MNFEIVLMCPELLNDIILKIRVREKSIILPGNQKDIMNVFVNQISLELKRHHEKHIIPVKLKKWGITKGLEINSSNLQQMSVLFQNVFLLVRSGDQK